jgi:hypothetical protein
LVFVVLVNDTNGAGMIMEMSFKIFWVKASGVPAGSNSVAAAVTDVFRKNQINVGMNSRIF